MPNKNVKIGNYRANVSMDPEGILESTRTRPKLGRLSKVEKDYLKGRKGSALESATEAVHRARKANKKTK